MTEKNANLDLFFIKRVIIPVGNGRLLYFELEQSVKAIYLAPMKRLLLSELLRHSVLYNLVW